MKKLIALILFAIITLPLAAQETVIISPTWGQAFSFANKAGNTGWVIFGIVLIAFAGFIIWQGSKENLTFIGLKQGLSVNLICFLLFAAGLTSILSKPLAVKWNNEKKVDKVYLQQVGEKYVWDSLENHCLIIDGPHNCK